MSETGERGGDEIQGHAGDVTEHAVTIRRGGARSVTAHAVTVRQGGIGRLHAADVGIVQGGVGLASVGNLRVTAGATGPLLADTVVLEQSLAKVVAARERVEMDQAAAGIVAGGSVHVRDSVIGMLVTPRFEGQEGVRVLMGPRAAFAFGAGVAAVLYLVGLWHRSGKSS
jgi:hypothetical protein